MNLRVQPSTWFLLLPVALAISLASGVAGKTVAEVRLDHAALVKAEDDYRHQREAGLDGIEAEDYASYIARLHRRVFEGCRSLVESGLTPPADLPCPPVLPRTVGYADISTQNEQTPQEQVAALDARLLEGLGEYDEELLREQERIKATAPRGDGGGGAGGPGGDGDSGTGEGGRDGRGDPGEVQDPPDKDDQAYDSIPGEAQPGAGNPENAGGPSDQRPGNDNDTDKEVDEDIPDGSDDDVVARQLREAAENEADPELKARLWEEYRRYKRGTS